MNKKTIFNFIFGLIFLWTIYYISWLVWVLSSILTFIFYCFISFLFYFLWKKLRKKEYLSFDKFINYFLFKVLIGIYISIFIIAWLSYYSNEKNPAPMPTYTISNWEKTIIFQAMSHIWSKNFYEKIKQDLKKSKQDWYVYFYEEVKDWTPENKEKFNKAIWIKFDKDLYKNFSKLYWVIQQVNSIYLNLENNLDYNVDLTIDEIIQYYEELWEKKENKKSILQTKETIDVNWEIIKTLSQLNEKELKILRYVNKAMLNLLIWNEKIQTTLTNNFTNKNLFEIILDKRNEVLSNEIIDSKYNKIYITYWLLHFKWVFKLLQNQDKNWKIIKTDYLYPIQ